MLWMAPFIIVGCGGGGENLDGSTFKTSSDRPSSTSEVTVAPTASTTTSVATTTTLPEGMPVGDDTTVVSVTDGDTIVVAGGTRVRLIGIDTPETRDPRKPVQCYGKEASAHARALMSVGSGVRLVYDVEHFDRYDRTLAYVYRLSDGAFVNASLVRDGYAQSYTYPPNVRHADEFVALAREAREAGRGLWSACSGFGVPAVTAGPATAPGAVTGCDAAYPGVCIAPYPPDLDCGEVAYKRFTVLAPDPHGFDRDQDGVGCQT